MKKEVLKFLALLLIAIGAGPASAAMWQWSKTAANNATADPTINYAEGMSPSSVNDSARAAMARTAEQRDDMSGSLTTGGTSTAYTVTSNQGMCLAPSTTPQTGQAITVTVHTTSGAAPTLQVDSCSAYPIQTSGAALATGLMAANNPYTLMFNGSAWITTNFYNSTYNVPLGGLVTTTISSAPNTNFVMADGHCISQSTYATYYAAIGSPGVGSCSAGNFNTPDIRGRALVGLDNMGSGGGGSNTAASRLTNSANGCGTTMTTAGATCANGNESRTLTAAAIPTITSNVTVSSITVTSTVSNINIGQSGSFAVSGGGLGVPSGLTNITSTGSGSGSATSSNTAGGGHSIVMPVIGYYVYVRVL